jgi:cardiolipin synthase
MMTRQAEALPPATQMPEGFTEPKAIARYLRHDSEVHVRPQPNPAFTVDHTKLYLVDGRYAYVGGMNVGREYRYEWHDLIAEVQGPVVASYQRQFNKKWAQAGPWGDLGLLAETIGGKRPAAVHDPNLNLIELRRLYTKNFSRQIRKAELAAMDRASSYIFAENPYLYSNEFINALVRARRRGVDVRVILPSENDLTAGRRSNLVTANHLREQGIRVYIFPGMTHVKALLVDGWSCFGSANFDALSLRLNREDDLATSDPAFAAKLKHDLFEADFKRAGELKVDLPEVWKDHLADALLNSL